MIKHSNFWFDDGSVLVVAEDTVYSLHRSLIARLSPHFFRQCCQLSNLPEGCNFDEASLRSLPCYTLRDNSNISKADFDILIAYILHEIDLADDSSFETVLRLYIVSSQEAGDFRKIYESVGKRLSAIMQRNPLDLEFSNLNLLEKAFSVSRNGGNSQLAILLRRALYYVCATHDDDPLESDERDSNPVERITEPAVTEGVMSKLSDRFSPTLFQPPAALHMQCTDVYASLWMERAVTPAFEDRGTADPFKTLRRLRGLDWKREIQSSEEERSEPCEECLEHMRQQWSDDAQAIWEMMDSWLVEEK